MKRIIALLVTLIFTGTLAAQHLVIPKDQILQSGPLNGYADMGESIVWIQNKEDTEMSMRYWPVSDSTTVYTSNAVQTSKEKAFTAKLIADEVMPGTTYAYEILVGGTPVEIDYPLTFKT